MRGVGRVRQWAGRIIPLPRAVILAYHRVADVETDPQLLCVSTGNFADHLHVLRQRFSPIGLRNLRLIALNRWRARSVVLTFDDGYADNLHFAKPRLEAAGIPATVFVTAGKVSSRRGFWWDELEAILLRQTTLPPALDLTIGGKTFHWDLPQEQNHPVDPGWHVLLATAPTVRHQIYLEIAPLIRNLPPSERESVMDYLFSWAGLLRAADESTRALTEPELGRLADGGIVEVGAHTVNHPVLSTLSSTEQLREISSSKRLLEELLGRPVTSFAYPYGGKSDYTRDSVAIVKAAGFRCACSNFEGTVTLAADPYQLPRYLIRDWDGDTFARHLESLFGA